MQKHTLSHAQSGYLSSLVLDYIQGHAFLKQFYTVAPTLEGLLAIGKPENFSHIQRSVLVAVLENQNRNLQLPAVVEKNIAALASENCYCIVTAHQLNIFTGPLYTIYKTVSAIKACMVLKEQKPDAHFVPVFYLGSEDHDFNEINHVHLFGKNITWNKDASGPCGRLSMDGMEKVLGDVQSILGGGVNAEKILHIFKAAYTTHKNLAEATRYILNALFGEYGLVII
ncbi:MAG: bacillithiol biosynthesis BshC, partial [Chitinophagales bacterium]